MAGGSGNRRRRFWIAVAAGFVLGLVLIAAVAASRDDDRPDAGVRLHQTQIKAKPLKAAAPTHRKGCTNIWTGHSESGRWTVAANWSRRRVPGPADRACLGPGTVVTLIAARARVGSVRDEGTLYALPGGELTLLDLSTPSQLKALVLAGGKLGGDASVMVQQLNWQEDGKMVDGGETVIPVGATATFLAGEGGAGLIGAKRQLVVRGDFVLVNGALYVDKSAKIRTYKTSHISIDDVSESGQPQGILKRETGQPESAVRQGRLVRLGTAGRRPHPGPSED